MKILLGLLLSVSAWALPPEAYVTFKWNPNPVEDEVKFYRLYVKNYLGNWRQISATGYETGATSLKIPFYAGKSYEVGLTAVNDYGESDKATLEFTVPWVESAKDIRVSLEISVQDGMRMKFQAPEMFVEENGVVFEWSTDLKNWSRFVPEYTYYDGYYYVSVPQMGARTFYRLGY